MLTPRNQNLGPEDPLFVKWYQAVLAAAIALWGAVVEGLDWARSGLVPELVVADKRILLNQMSYGEFQKGRTIADFLAKAGVVLPTPPPIPEPPAPIYVLYTPFLDPVDGYWYKYMGWPFNPSGVLRVRIEPPPAPTPVEVTPAVAVAKEREDTSAYIQGVLVSKPQPQVVIDVLIAALTWVASRPK